MNVKYKEGEIYEIYRKGDRKKLIVKITLKEDFCKKAFNRMLFFKYNIPIGDYIAIRVGFDG